jgi:hypothetical protein
MELTFSKPTDNVTNTANPRIAPGMINRNYGPFEFLTLVESTEGDTAPKCRGIIADAIIAQISPKIR